MYDLSAKKLFNEAIDSALEKSEKDIIRLKLIITWTKYIIKEERLEKKIFLYWTLDGFSTSIWTKIFVRAFAKKHLPGVSSPGY